MKLTHKATHSYEELRKERNWSQFSEKQHLLTINNLIGKKGTCPQKKDPDQRKVEREAIKAAMYAHPADKHAPDNSTVVLEDAYKQAA